MVTGKPTIHFAIKRQQRKLNHPQEIELIRRNLKLTHFHEFDRSVLANAPEDFTGVEPFISSE